MSQRTEQDESKPSYRLIKNLLGKVLIAYPCEHCGDELRSPLADAGQQQTCPTCHRDIRVPKPKSQPPPPAPAIQQTNIGQPAKTSPTSTQRAGRVVCGNCDRTLGKLETPRQWKGQAVCAACYKLLDDAGPDFSKPMATVRPALTEQRSGSSTIVKIAAGVFLLIVGGVVVLFVITAAVKIPELNKASREARAIAAHSDLQNTLDVLLDWDAGTMKNWSEESAANQREALYLQAQRYRDNVDPSDASVWKSDDEFKQRLDLAERAVKQGTLPSEINIFQPDAGLPHPEAVKPATSQS